MLFPVKKPVVALLKSTAVQPFTMSTSTLRQRQKAKSGNNNINTHPSGGKTNEHDHEHDHDDIDELDHEQNEDSSDGSPHHAHDEHDHMGPTEHPKAEVRRLRGLVQRLQSQLRVAKRHAPDTAEKDHSASR